jgi:hypothetical protein
MGPRDFMHCSAQLQAHGVAKAWALLSGNQTTAAAAQRKPPSCWQQQQPATKELATQQQLASDSGMVVS